LPALAAGKTVNPLVGPLLDRFCGQAAAAFTSVIGHYYDCGNPATWLCRQRHRDRACHR
jgi:hypothetical protein